MDLSSFLKFNFVLSLSRLHFVFAVALLLLSLDKWMWGFLSFLLRLPRECGSDKPPGVDWRRAKDAARFFRYIKHLSLSLFRLFLSSLCGDVRHRENEKKRRGEQT